LGNLWFFAAHVCDPCKGSLEEDSIDKLKTGKMGIGGLYKFCKVAGLNPMIVFDDEI